MLDHELTVAESSSFGAQAAKLRGCDDGLNVSVVAHTENNNLRYHLRPYYTLRGVQSACLA